MDVMDIRDYYSQERRRLAEGEGPTDTQQVADLVDLIYQASGMPPEEQAQFIFDAGYRKITGGAE